MSKPVWGMMVVMALVGRQAAWAESIEVFTDAHFPIQTDPATPVMVHDCSAHSRVLSEIGRDLPNNPALAKRIVDERLNAGLRQHLADAYAGPMLASQYGIVKIPAIVFDHGEAVTYGLTDVNQAIELYRRWKERR